jgi:hypothetical protein
MHAPRVGLVPGICVYPQPPSRPAVENLELVLSRKPRPPVTDLPHWSALPYGVWLTYRRCKQRGARAFIMEPGGAIPIGALGYVSAAFELAEQIANKDLPVPTDIVVAAGSNCTSAGLLVGLSLAAEAKLGFGIPPRLTSVRVTPWPVTSPLRILRLAVRTSKLLADLTGDASLRRTRRALAPHFRILTNYIGPGYGFPTAEGREAMALWAEHAGHALETTYSGKSAAAVVDMVRDGSPGPIVYWSTKTSAERPVVNPDDLDWAPKRMRRWMEEGRSTPA